MFGQILKELRIDKGISQAQLAKAIGVVQGTIYFWENEINEPAASSLLALSDFFGVTVDYLLGNDSESAQRHNDPLEVLVLYNRMSKKQKNLALSVMNAILNN